MHLAQVVLGLNVLNLFGFLRRLNGEIYRLTNEKCKHINRVVLINIINYSIHVP